MDTAQWPQEIVVKPMEEIIVPNTCPSNSVPVAANIISNNKKSSPSSSTSLERKVRPQKEQALNCPRCNSTNTKFCYYNNYSLTQPRYFCKACRRYWTEGGSLRNIPVGGGSRKNKRPSSSFASSNSSSLKLIHHDLMISAAAQAQSFLNLNPKIHHAHGHNHNHNDNHNNSHYHNPHQGQDLNLGFPPTLDTTHHDILASNKEFRSLSEYAQLQNFQTPTSKSTQLPNSSASCGITSNANLSAVELLNGLNSSRGLAPFTPISVPTDPHGVYSSGFSLHDFKPTLNFSLDVLPNHGYGSLQGGVQQEETNTGRLLFPFEDLKPVSSNTTSTDHLDNNDTSITTTAAATTNEMNRSEQGNSTGYWSGLLGTGGSW